MRTTTTRSLRVRMDLVNKCNLRCQMCHVSLPEVRAEPRFELSPELFDKIARELLPNTRSLILTVGYEPLLSKSFPHVLEEASKYGLPEFSYITNGTFLDADNIERTIRAGVTEVVVSLDGATKETYETIRRGSNFEKVVGNLRALQARKQELGSSTPEIRIGMVLMRKNIEELPALLRLCHDLGVKNVNATHMIPHEGLGMRDESLSLPHHRALANRCLDEARQVAEELELNFAPPVNFSDADPALESSDVAPEPVESGASIGPAAVAATAQPGTETTAPDETAVAVEIASSSAQPIDSGAAPPEPLIVPRTDDTSLPDRPDSVCHWPWQDTVIFPDGNVAPCCYWYDSHFMGNLNEESFEAIWHGPKYRELRQQLLDGELNETCSRCPMNRDSGQLDGDGFDENPLDYRAQVTLDLKIEQQAGNAVLFGRLYNRLPSETTVTIAARVEGPAGDAAEPLFESRITLPRKSEQVSSVALPAGAAGAGRTLVVEVRGDDGRSICEERSPLGAG